MESEKKNHLVAYPGTEFLHGFYRKGMERDAETIRLIVKHRLNVLWHEGYHRCWLVSQDDTPMGCASSSKSIHTAVRKAATPRPVSSQGKGG